MRAHAMCIAHPSCINILESVPQVNTSENYGVMWYKNGHNIGIREKFDQKRQVITFGSGTGKSEKELRAWADKCLTKLDAGYDVADVLSWVRAATS